MLADGNHMKSLVTHAVEHVRSTPALRPDLDAADDRLLTSICQFDLLAALAVIDTTRNTGWHPNFARFYTIRSEPAVDRLPRDSAMRAEIFNGSDDALADALRHIDDIARREAFTYAGWTGFASNRVMTFLNEHPARQPP